jgi:hypothetical protein
VLQRLYCCPSHSIDQGQLQHAWREGRLRVAAKATPTTVSWIPLGIISLLCAPWFRRSSDVWESSNECRHMARVEARGMQPLGAGRRDVTLHGSNAKLWFLPRPSINHLPLSATTQFSLATRPHSHMILRRRQLWSRPRKTSPNPRPRDEYRFSLAASLPTYPFPSSH